MMSSNYMCQLDGKQATAFCFNGLNKTTLCDDHVASTFKKGLLAFPLEAIDFMQKIEDYPAYNQATERVSKGLANVQIYRESLNSERESALQRLAKIKLESLQALAESFQKLSNQIESQFANREKELHSLELEYSDYRRRKGSDLSDSAKLLCTILVFPPPLLKFVTWLSEIDLARTVFSTYSMETRKLSELIFLTKQGLDYLTSSQVDCVNRLKKNGSPPAIAEANVLCRYLSAHLELENSEVKQRLATHINTLHTVKLAFEEVDRAHQYEVSMLLADTRSTETIETLTRDYRKMSESDRSAANLDHAKEVACKALQLVEASKLRSSESVNVYLQLALILKEMRNYAEADKYLTIALSLAMENPGSKEVARCLRRFGDLYEEVEKFEKAEESYKASLKVYETNHPEDMEVCTTYINLGIFYENRERLQDAANAWTCAIKHAQEHEDLESARQVQEYLDGVRTPSHK